MLESTCSAPWLLSILPIQPVRNQFFSEKKIPRESSDHLQFDRNSNHFLEKYDWKREFLEMERQGQTGQRGPPLEVDRFDRKISSRTQAFHLPLYRNP